MRVSLLGPVGLAVGGQQVPVGRRTRRLLLALLAADANVDVSLARIVDVLWETDPPPTARNQVQVHVSGLRRLLGAAPGPAGPPPIATTRAGYLLNAPPVAVDLLEFAALRAEADRLLAAGLLEDAGQRLRAALLLWRGEPLGGLDGAFAAAEAARLRQYRLAVLERRADIDLVTGLVGDRPAGLVGELTGLVAAEPLHEGLRRRLMLALYQAGRTAEALAVYRDGRRLLVAEHGIEPGPVLRAAEAALLRGDPPEALIRDLLPAPAAQPGAAPAAAPLAVPAQLPGDVYGFAGRAEYLAELDGLLVTAAAAEPGAVVIAAVTGTAGVGKSALAVHWARRVADRFPDGQLYVNLRGFDPSGQALDPATAVRGFLDALGVPPRRVPAGLDAQVALYRSVLAGRRVLVVLDNARDAEQARPLLPASPTAFAVVTSRDALTGLVASDGALPVALDLLSAAEARDLLAGRLPGRTDREPAAVQAIVTACARLPLALTIAGARAQQSRHPLGHLAGELAGAAGRLGALDTGDPATRVAAVFSWSYRTLTPAAARLFRLLGGHPGPDVSAAAAASLAGEPLPRTRPLLAELTRASLLSEHAPGRYAGHDLLTAYAADLHRTLDPDADRAAAARRLLDHYVHTAWAAARLLDPAREPSPVPLDPPAAGTAPEELADEAAATAWFAAERPVLLAVLRLAAGTGAGVLGWQLAWASTPFLHRRGYWHDWIAGWQAALPAADRLGPSTAGYAYRQLAQASTLLGRYADARRDFERALRLYAAAGEPAGQAHTHYALALLSDRQQQPERCREHAARALALFEAAGDRRGQAIAHNAVGWSYAQAGQHGAALAHCRLALELFGEAGDRWGEATTWDSLGLARHGLGQYTEAVDCYRQALRLFADLGSAYQEARTLDHLAGTRQAAGEPAAARAAWTRSLRLLTELGHAEAAAVRARLAALDRVPAR
jgi:DNA-binding SARP family transcriptional activator/tetratricopeptide (TPR) repeat protein